MGNNSTCIEWLTTMDIVIIVAVIGLLLDPQSLIVVFV